VDGDADVIAEAGHGFVDGVVNDFVDEVVEAALIGGADVHAGTAPNGLEALEHLDVSCGVLVLLRSAYQG
jgi:hypothetical protein